ncbi:hypothetical protein GH714_006169 [Hevea brasiliensis]|uniref:Uncharacterized protein n=1 Tax=Hevea brasiliensis TaxID=3981 RepID=A0A6A6KY76_HEVBR|nr:hypothetical protein GH714_006169 [Hevea brasiliensis]
MWGHEAWSRRALGVGPWGLKLKSFDDMIHGPLIPLFNGMQGPWSSWLPTANAWTSYCVACLERYRLPFWSASSPCSGHFVLGTRVLVADTWTSYCVVRKDLGVHRLHFVGHFCLRACDSVADEWTSYCVMRKGLGVHRLHFGGHFSL